MYVRNPSPHVSDDLRHMSQERTSDLVPARVYGLLVEYAGSRVHPPSLATRLTVNPASTPREHMRYKRDRCLSTLRQQRPLLSGAFNSVFDNEVTPEKNGLFLLYCPHQRLFAAYAS